MIRGSERRLAEDPLEALLVEGLQGEESELTSASWTEWRRELTRNCNLSDRGHIDDSTR